MELISVLIAALLWGSFLYELTSPWTRGEW